MPARALFVFIGAQPYTSWLVGSVALYPDGFLRTGEAAALTLDLGQANPLPLEISRRGVFAVGEVRSGSIKRVASAVQEGAMAVQ